VTVWIGSRRATVATVLALVLVWASACHSYHIDMTVENRTGGTVQLLEVNYPSASFGVGSLASGEVYRYRAQLRGSSPLKLQYTGKDGRQTLIEGPVLTEPQEGRLEIVLLPNGKADFRPELTDAMVRIKPKMS
jgi:hypothetical protein